MKVTVNGEMREIATGTTVEMLVQEMNGGPPWCAGSGDRPGNPGHPSRRGVVTGGPAAVEVNRVLVRLRDHPTRVLSDGDQIEIVTLVGGG